MSDFAQVLAGASPDSEGRTVSIPESWHQGRTAYGGFSSALCLAEAMRVEPSLPPLRSAQIAMVAPLSGDVSVTATVMRQGRNATWITAHIDGDKGVGVIANFVFMRPIESTVRLEDRLPPPDLIPVEDARPFVNERAPAFVRYHFDVRFAVPKGERGKPELCWWVRPCGHASLDPTVALLLSGDALPPAVMPLLATGVPVSTMHWQVNLLDAAPRTADGWWLLRSRSDYARDGCSSQAMAAWNTSGEPTLSGMQSIALFG
jgi:hypothetical protein